MVTRTQEENIALMYDNPSDFILDCLVGLEKDEIVGMKAQFTDAKMTDVVYDADKEKEEVEEEGDKENGPPFVKRFRILVHRRIRETIRHQECVAPRAPEQSGPLEPLRTVRVCSQGNGSVEGSIGER